MDGDTTLALLGGFSLHHRRAPIQLQTSGQRLLAFLAIHDRALPRAHVAGNLWSSVVDERSQASLRSALWRLKRIGVDTVESLGHCLQLFPSIRVDIHEVTRRADSVLDGDSPRGPVVSHTALTEDLLPGWYEDWVVLERERLRQLRLHILEATTARLVHEQKYAQAIDVAFAAVRGEPLRESAQRRLIEAYIAEGNKAEAIRQYRDYCSLLQRELGVAPSGTLRGLMVSAMQS